MKLDIRKYAQIVKKQSRSLDLDHFDEGVELLVKCVENAADGVIIQLYDDIERMIFAGYNEAYINEYALKWMSDAGRDAESDMDCLQFEKKVREIENIGDEISVRLLYWYDFEALINALQDRLSSIVWMIKEFYSILPINNDFETKKPVKTIFSMNSNSMKCYTLANTMFVTLASSFDLISKIAMELECYKKYNFLRYTKLKSSNILYNKNLNVSPLLKSNGMLFSSPESNVVRLILTLRDEYVHNGPWDRSVKIYHPFDKDDNLLNSYMFMPDMNENGTLMCTRGRNKFYSQNKKLNLELPNIITSAIKIIETTIIGLRCVAKTMYDENLKQC